MIRYSLICDRKHDFEAWFNNSADYDRQRKRGLVACPLCDSKRIEKALMAPRLGRGTRKGEIAAPAEAAPPVPPAADDKAAVAMVPPQERELRAKLKELRDHLVKNADNVGAKFPEQARKIHYGEVERRSIYGEASPKEAKELHDEGIEFHPLPTLPDDWN